MSTDVPIHRVEVAEDVVRWEADANGVDLVWYTASDVFLEARSLMLDGEAVGIEFVDQDGARRAAGTRHHSVRRRAAGSDASELERLRAENEAAWRRPVALPDFALVANTASAAYIPALESEVALLRHILERILDDDSSYRLGTACDTWSDEELAVIARTGGDT